jgi:DNA-binding transcriptional MocR family regulator
MAELRVRLARERDRTAERLGQLGIVPWTMPRGGFYLWCRLPDGLDSSEVARRCMDEGVVLAPGNVFSVSQSAGSFLRFNVAQMAGERTYDAIHAAIVASHELAQGEL